MEDIIAANPESFFPRHGFVLQGRQQSFRGVGIFDLLFTDRHGMNILMELKAVPARYEVIDQVARYRDALVAQGHANIIMWIVAPSIPPGLRDFLSHLGIEYTEIHSSEISRVAALTGYTLRNSLPIAGKDGATGISQAEAPDSVSSSDAVSQRTAPERRASGVDEWGFGTGTQPSFLLRALEAGNKTKEQIRSEFINHFYPHMDIAEAKSKSGFNVFFSDSKRPIGTYHASRSLLLVKDTAGCLSLDGDRARLAKDAIANGILDKLRGLDFKRDKPRFDDILRSFGLPVEA